jgi:hypothetical protein
MEVAWRDTPETPIDAVIWCTGFRPALGHVAGLGLVGADGTVELDGTGRSGSRGFGSSDMADGLDQPRQR